MPTYAYVCTECGYNFDAVQSFTDAPLTECPQCSGRLRKRFSPVGVVFKGSGFYRTDSRKPEKSADSSPDKPADKSPDKASGKPSGSGEKKTEKKSDTTPAAATSSAS